MANKYTYLYVIQGYRDRHTGWEGVRLTEDRVTAQGLLRGYRESKSLYYARVTFRMIRRRELNA